MFLGKPGYRMEMKLSGADMQKAGMGGMTMATLGFAAGYAVNFATIIALYTIATALYWIWFRDADRRALGARVAVP